MNMEQTEQLADKIRMLEQQCNEINQQIKTLKDKQQSLNLFNQDIVGKFFKVCDMYGGVTYIHVKSVTRNAPQPKYAYIVGEKIEIADSMENDQEYKFLSFYSGPTSINLDNVEEVTSDEYNENFLKCIHQIR